MAHRVIIRNLNEVYVHIECDDGIGYELREHFTFQVPGYQFTPQYKARLWDGRIRIFDIRTNLIYRGLVPEIVKFCENRKYEWRYDNEDCEQYLSLEDANNFIKKLNLNKVEPRDYQIEAFIHAINTKRSLILSPTASGKSLILYMILRYIHDLNLSKKTLIIVPTISLVTQLHKDFQDYGYDSDKYIHKVFSGQEKDSDKQIIISTWQSVFKLDESYFESFDCIIGDEAHLFKAKSLTDIMTKAVNAKYRIGTTGTLDGTKTHKLVLEGLFGSVKKVITTKELMDKNYLSEFQIKCLLLKHNDIICQSSKNFTYQQEIEYLVLNSERNKFISNLSISLEGNTLILYQYVEKHGKILNDIISSKVDEKRKVFFIYGKTDADIRNEVRGIVEKEKNAIIIASYGVFSTGVNIKNLHNVVFASPSKSRIRNLQSIGRALRKGDNKQIATLYDIADDMRYKKHENYTLKHFAERIRIYNEEKFKFKIYKVNLNG